MKRSKNYSYSPHSYEIMKHTQTEQKSYKNDVHPALFSKFLTLVMLITVLL